MNDFFPAKRGICLDCDKTQLIDQFGKCIICGSASIFTPGAVKTLHDLLQHMEAEEQMKRDKEKNTMNWKVSDDRLIDDPSKKAGS